MEEHERPGLALGIILELIILLLVLVLVGGSLIALKVEASWALRVALGVFGIIFVFQVILDPLSRLWKKSAGEVIRDQLEAALVQTREGATKVTQRQQTSGWILLACVVLGAFTLLCAAIVQAASK